jgi:DNA invertase Pin-like site-specific DNA recombinase
LRFGFGLKCKHFIDSRGGQSLGDTWADTTTSHGRLMLTVLGGLAEFERELIHARTSEGSARAVANGVKLGRKPILTPHQRREAIKRVNAEKETLGEILNDFAINELIVRPSAVRDALRI